MPGRFWHPQSSQGGTKASLSEVSPRSLRAWLCRGPSTALGRSWDDLGQEFLVQPLVLSSHRAKCPVQVSPWEGTNGWVLKQRQVLVFRLLPMAEFNNDKNPLRQALPLRCLWHFPSCVCFLPPPRLNFAVSSGCRSLSQAGTE